MKRSIYIIFILLVWCAAGKAQHLPQYSQYLLNDYVMNPAIGGSRPFWEVKSSNRYQWMGITDAPRTYVLGANGPNRTGKMGLGGYLFTDIVGPTRRIGLSFTYAYHLKLTESIRLSLGLSAGLLQFSIDASKLNLHDEYDLVLYNAYQKALVPDFGCGFYLYHEKFYAGISAPQIYPSKLILGDHIIDPQSRLATHYYASAGYRHRLTDDFLLEPCLLVKYVSPVPLKADLGIKVTYKEDFWLGGAYRTNDAISAMAGFRYRKNLSFGYSYDFTTTNIKNYSTGTHEIMIGIRFNETVE